MKTDLLLAEAVDLLDWLHTDTKDEKAEMVGCFMDKVYKQLRKKLPEHSLIKDLKSDYLDTDYKSWEVIRAFTGLPVNFVKWIKHDTN